MSTAIVIGATGLVGRCLVKQLLEDPGTTRLVALVRRAVLPRHDKLQELVVDFEKPESFADAVHGDVLFSALGTTLGQAGSIAAQRRVDYDYQLEVARLAAKNGVKTYVLVSSGAANPRSRMAYLKMKGELERDVKSLGFASLQILQPGLLTGAREKPRRAEKLVEAMMHVVGFFVRSLRPISGDQVATAMRKAAAKSGTVTYAPAEVLALGAGT